VVATGALLGCGTPGELRFPGGSAPVRTAWFHVDTQPTPTLRVFLSSSVFPCRFPSVDSEAFDTAQADLQVAACREGAHHVGLTLYQQGAPPFDGRYPAEAGASELALGPDRPRLASGSYFGVDEAFLVEVDGLKRAYSPSEETYLPDLGRGEVSLADGDRLRGDFAFDAGVYGSFQAEACDAEDGLLELLVSAPLQLCP